MSNRQLTAQMLFDDLARHLLTQGKRSLTYRADSVFSESCAYRGDGGLRCPVGAAILDHEYTPAMEGCPVVELATRGLLPSRLKTHVTLLRDLQNVHDGYEPPDWRSALWRVAMRCGLSAAVLDVAA